MNTKHTPGPWTCEPKLRPDLDDDPMGEYVLSIAGDLNRRYFAAEPETTELAAIHAENMANARLIAAAPELLAACQNISSLFEGPEHLHPMSAQWQAEFNNAMLAIRTAIQHNELKNLTP